MHKNLTLAATAAALAPLGYTFWRRGSTARALAAWAKRNNFERTTTLTYSGEVDGRPVVMAMDPGKRGVLTARVHLTMEAPGVLIPEGEFALAREAAQMGIKMFSTATHVKFVSAHHVESWNDLIFNDLVDLASAYGNLPTA